MFPLNLTVTVSFCWSHQKCHQNVVGLCRFPHGSNDIPSFSMFSVTPNDGPDGEKRCRRRSLVFPLSTDICTHFRVFSLGQVVLGDKGSFLGQRISQGSLMLGHEFSFLRQRVSMCAFKLFLRDDRVLPFKGQTFIGEPDLCPMFLPETICEPCYVKFRQILDTEGNELSYATTLQRRLAPMRWRLWIVTTKGHGAIAAGVESGRHGAPGGDEEEDAAEGVEP